MQQPGPGANHDRSSAGTKASNKCASPGPGTGINNSCASTGTHRVHCVDTAPPDLLPGLQEHFRARLDEFTAFMGVGAEVAGWDEKLEPWINWDDSA